MKRNSIRKFADEVMGRQVTFSRVFRRFGLYTSNRVETYHWEPVSLGGPKVGWAVGVRWLQRGRRWPGSYAEGPSFEETGARVPCVLVSRWPTHAPEKVPFDDIELVEFEQKLYAWPESERTLVSNQSRGWPRDEKGRFAPEPQPAKVEEMDDSGRTGVVAAFGKPVSKVDA